MGKSSVLTVGLPIQNRMQSAPNYIDWALHTVMDGLSPCSITGSVLH